MSQALGPRQLTRALSAAEVIELLELERHPREGGYIRSTHRDEYSTAIYYLMTPSEFSGLHVLAGTEIHHFLAGWPSHQLLLYPDGRVGEPILGDDLAGGERPQRVVPSGVWQAQRPLGPWTLISATMAPGFEWSIYADPEVERVVHRWPAAERRIRDLVHPDQVTTDPSERASDQTDMT